MAIDYQRCTGRRVPSRGCLAELDDPFPFELPILTWGKHGDIGGFSIVLGIPQKLDG